MIIAKLTIYTNNLLESKKFYQSLGFKPHLETLDRLQFKTDLDHQYLEVRLNQENTHKNEISFRLDNASGVFQKCRLLGIPVVSDYAERNGRYSFKVKDHYGNLIEFIQLRNISQPVAPSKPKEEIQSPQREVINSVSKEDVYKALDYIVRESFKLFKTYIDYQEINIDYVSIYPKDSFEFTRLKGGLKFMGRKALENEGELYALYEQVKTPEGSFKYVKLSDPIKAGKVGDCHFWVKDYEDFKNTYKNTDMAHIFVVKRPSTEKMEVADDKFNAKAFVSEQPITQSLQLT